MRVVFVANGFVWNPFIEIEIEPARSPRWYLDARYQAVSLFSPGAVKRPGFRGGSNTGEWSHEEVPEVFA